MTKKPKLPAHTVYEDGVGRGSIASHVELNGAVWDGIEWDTPIETPQPVQQATSNAATQFHYANTSHLILCGRLLQHDIPGTSTDDKKLGVCLAARKVEDADIWGRYLQKTGGGHSIAPALKEFYQQLFSETQVLPMVIGMETLGGPAAHAIYTAIQEGGDPVFQKISANMVEQKEKEMEVACTYLEPTITELSDAERAELMAAAEHYQGRVADILETQLKTIHALDINPLELQQQISETIERFYTDLGLVSDR